MITISPKGDSYRYGFVVEGHAEFAEHGQDIVCAAASAIAQTALKGIKWFTDVRFKVESGRLAAEVLHSNTKSDTIIKTMLMGLEDLALQFPDYVSIKYVKGDDMTCQKYLN